MSPLHSVSVTGIVVRDDGRVLAIRRNDNGRWVPPGGVLELDETPQEGVAREVLEETGYEVRPVRLAGVYKNMRTHVVALAFRCAVTGGAARTSPESDEVRWLTAGEVAELMVPAMEARTQDGMAGEGVALRMHDGNRLLDVTVRP